MKSLKLFVLSFIMCFSPFCLAQDSISEQGEIQQFVFSIDDAAEVVEQPQEEKQEKEFLEGYIEVKDEKLNSKNLKTFCLKRISALLIG